MEGRRSLLLSRGGFVNPARMSAGPTRSAPGRAGIFANLAPIFGASFAVLILSERFTTFHLAALEVPSVAFSPPRRRGDPMRASER